MDKQITVIVNGTQKTLPKEDFTFDEIVKLAYDSPPYGEFTAFSVTYRKGKGQKEETLDQGDSVKVKDGMIFDVTAADRS